jgi:hypothetical protein
MFFLSEATSSDGYIYICRRRFHTGIRTYSRSCLHGFVFIPAFAGNTIRDPCFGDGLCSTMAMAMGQGVDVGFCSVDTVNSIMSTAQQRLSVVCDERDRRRARPPAGRASWFRHLIQIICELTLYCTHLTMRIDGKVLLAHLSRLLLAVSHIGHYVWDSVNV